MTNGFPIAKCLAVEGATSWFGPDISCEREYGYFHSITRHFPELSNFQSQRDHAAHHRKSPTVGIPVIVSHSNAASIIIAKTDMNW